MNSVKSDIGKRMPMFVSFSRKKRRLLQTHRLVQSGSFQAVIHRLPAKSVRLSACHLTCNWVRRKQPPLETLCILTFTGGTTYSHSLCGHGAV